jgi:hypothetical protein
MMDAYPILIQSFKALHREQCVREPFPSDIMPLLFFDCTVKQLR